MKQRRDKSGRVKDSFWQKWKSWRLGRAIRKGKLPRGRTSAEVHQAIQGTLRGQMTEVWGVLSARLIRAGGEVLDMGVISTKKVTTAFRDYLVDSLQNSTTYPLSAFRYHGCGTGTTAEANTQTALVTEVGSRVSGTGVEGASANIFRTVATLTPGGSYAITEHGVFSAASAGVLMDRSLFSAINVGASDSIEFTYECTFNAEA